MARVKTGIPGLDEMLHGGLMHRDITLVAGSPGVGKTLLGLQFLVNGATKFDEPGVIVTFEQLPQQLYRDALNFGWDLKELEEENKLRVICTSPSILLKEETAKILLEEPVREIDAKRVVIDPISYFQMVISDLTKLRQRIYSFVNYLKVNELTAILTHELPDIVGGSIRISEYGVEFVVDSIILLRFVEIESSMKKALSILKMRGSDHDKSLREFEITSKGIEVKTKFKGREGLMSGAPRARIERIEEFFESSNGSE